MTNIRVNLSLKLTSCKLLIMAPPRVGPNPTVQSPPPNNESGTGQIPNIGGLGTSLELDPNLFQELPAGWNKQGFRSGYPMMEAIRGSASTDTLMEARAFTDKSVMLVLKEKLGASFSAAFEKKEGFKNNYTFSTKSGPLTVQVNYRSEYNDIFFTLTDTQTTGTSLRLVLDENKQPKQLISVDDPNNFFAGVFNDWGIPQISQALGPVNNDNYGSRIRKINSYDEITEELRKASSSPEKRANIDGKYSGPDNGIFVNQNEYDVAPSTIPLATAGVNTCSVLIVVSQREGRHYLAHIDSSADSASIADSIKGRFSYLDETVVYIMEGLQPSGTAQNIYSAAKELGIQDQIKFVSYRGTGMFPQIGIQNGNLFDPTVTFSRKSKAKVQI